MYEDKNPNLEDVLRQDIFDLIINVYHKNSIKESKKDENLIKKWAVKTEVPIVNDAKVLGELVHKLKKQIVA